MSQQQSDSFGLEQFDDGFTPSKGFQNDLAKIPDGNYEFLITKTNLKRVGAAQTTIFEITLRVVGGEYDGATGIKAVFLKSDESVSIFGGELSKLGFDADTWNAKHGKKFSVEFLKIKDTLGGLSFKGAKKLNKDERNREFLNIYVNELLPGRRPIPAPTAVEDMDIPF